MAGELQRSLSRTRDALEKTRTRRPLPKKVQPGPVATQLGVLAIVLLVVAITTRHPWLIAVALIAAAAGGALFVAPNLRELLQGGPGVGMGATVAQDAVLEEGASVEMGATVGRRAVIRSRAVVRMGATVGEGAVLEKDAIVSWGATVQSGARVFERAIVGAGSEVLKGAQVPAGMWLKPGTTYGGAQRALEPRPQAALPAAVSPRDARVAAACDKLADELRASPERVREFLGGSEETVAALRRTCDDLARRERELREESEPGALQRLAEERDTLEKRLGAERDEQIRGSLAGAISAIDDQKRQRDQLRLAADRLDAEHTRLLYTLEGLAAQFVRLRSAGVTERPPELDQSVAQLRSELDAISDALEEVARPAASAEAARPPLRTR